MTDIVERLRSDKPLIHRSDIDDAVRELDRLNAQTLELVREIERLRGDLTVARMDLANAEMRERHAKSERDELRGLLREARYMLDGNTVEFSEPTKLVARIDAALGTAATSTVVMP